MVAKGASLFGKALDVLDEELKSASIKDNFDSNDWRWDLIVHRLLNEVISKLKQSRPSNNPEDRHTLIWKSSKDWLFIVQSACEFINQQDDQHDLKLWKVIWS